VVSVTGKPIGLAVRVMLEDSSGQILLLRRSGTSKTNPGKWEIPGGKVDQGENFSDALFREVREETGLSFSVHGALGVAEQDLPAVHAVHLIMRGLVRETGVSLSDEHDSFRWVKRGDLPGMDLADWLRSYVRSAAFREWLFQDGPGQRKKNDGTKEA
jgi:8-oxo-dGTP diphosphatase